MKNTKAGFSLIELLVVVLIIGILAAVAVPQYQKSAKKAKWVAAFPQFNTIMHELELNYLEKGEWLRGNHISSNHEIGTEMRFGPGKNRSVMCEGLAKGEVCSYRHHWKEVIVIADLYSSIVGQRADCMTNKKNQYLCDAFCDTFGPCTIKKINP